MNNLKFLDTISKDILKSENKIYRGAVPWILFCSNEKKIIYISTSNRNLENYYDMLENLNPKQKKISMFENISSKKEDLTGINIELLDILKNQSDFILFLNLQITLDIFFEKVNMMNFEIGNKYKFSDIIGFLTDNGYSQSYLVEKKGEFSKRGDIIDIFPPDCESPVRLEFFDNELESIREFDIDSQISSVKKEKIKIFGNILSGNNYEFVELIEELKKDDVIIVMENEELLNYKMEEYILIDRNKEEIYRKRYENLKKKSIITETTNFTEEQLKTFKDKEELKKLSEKKNVQIYTKNYERKLQEYSVINENKKKNCIDIIEYELFEGFIAGETIILTDRELDGYIYEKKRKSNKAIKYKKVNQILVDDYVIHIQYGVGIYKGIETMENRDYLKIKYADEDILYIPVEKLDRLEKYISYGEEPKLFKLGTRGFKKKRDKLSEDIEKFAAELIKIQAQRQSQNGFVYGKDTVWQEEFEAQFPFEETEDQKKAIKDVKDDMEGPYIMDRIVCGDVGYGKTEVAMRAAFKALENSRQVALIAPTTVLAEQHYKRFKQRYENYPVIIENLSRLTQSRVKEILKNIKNGVTDMVIGTHRLLSDDVEFKNLGLLIIDEEQKFGVKAKETIKKKRQKVDVLTLTATPIPRTLNLALLGIREISVIDTPPTNRLPIITEVIDWNEDTVKTAILKELSRDGQVFYIYNDVKHMKYKIEELRKILPDFVKTEFIHGQLTPKEIKDKIRRFERGEFDILLASTIIENGIDIPNANTILIENFSALGLSQVYQLRGRVGRSNRQGYCYLLKTRTATKKGKKKEESIHKVEGIKSGGFQISMEDLKIRGAGEILGEKQHGTIETFGYDLYIKMLNEEIKRQKGEYRKKIQNVEIILKEKGFIPENYIQKEERLNVYKRFALAENFEELDRLVSEIRDRFGKIPVEMKKFIISVKFKIFAEINHIQIIEEERNFFRFSFVGNVDEEIIKKLKEKIKMKEVQKNYIFEKNNEENEIEENFIIMEADKDRILKYLKSISGK
ncbi:DEAD/DEAH box helicase [Leptotrichia sp. OH3620_COT-345]|uniref:DEAD/DEAH box helicase n=1 Tax=Leptotrichia sp. OH3620_COT-345 TaxID=2491048 RepID=UPI000F650E2A|nr:DEAD/DEAH box helicase [Leptotrichia sp. OH3620_COT-345]RRD40786.1 DEAD/DEAH box helicase [Leptotrichia sp. OH3620_COT-345]